MNRKNKRKHGFLFGLLALLLVSLVTPICATSFQVSVEAATVRLNTTKKTLKVGKTYRLKVKNATGKVKWSTNKKSIVRVSSNGKVTAKKPGRAYVYARVNGKKLKCLITVVDGQTIQTEQKTEQKSEVDQVIALVNKERKKRGLCELKKNSYLTSAAKTRSKEIVQFFSHTRPNGTSCFTAVSSKYDYHTLGENIAYGYPTPESVMSAWMNSQGHKDNILDSSFTEIGVAVYEKNGAKYWVQVFGSRW